MSITVLWSRAKRYIFKKHNDPILTEDGDIIAPMSSQYYCNSLRKCELKLRDANRKLALQEEEISMTIGKLRLEIIDYRQDNCYLVNKNKKLRETIQKLTGVAK